MRKLAIFAFSFSAAVLFAQYFLENEWLLCIAAGICAAGFCGLALRDRKRLAVMLTAFGFAFGLGYCWVYDAVFYAPACEMDGYSGLTEMTVSDFPEETDYGYKMTVLIHTDDIRTVRSTLYCYGTDEVPEYNPGDVLRAKVTLALADSIYGEDTDVFTSKGVLLFAYAEGGIYFREDNGFSVRWLPQYASHCLKNKIQEIFPEDTSAFVTALITGDKSLLTSDSVTYGNLKTAGIYHVVAVSGMHVAFLVGLVQLLVRKKRLASALCIPVIIFFVMMTGNTPSVTRAGIMQIFMLALPLFKRENDIPTSLAASLMLVLLMNPYSVKSAGLQLSYTSIAGIYIFSDKIYNGITGKVKAQKFYSLRPVRGAFNFIAASLSSTCGAMIFSLPLTAFYFGSISLIAPVTNLLTLWAVSLSFGLGIISCAAGALWLPAGRLLAEITSWPVRYILFASGKLAGLKYAAVYTVNEYIIYWAVFAYFIIFLFIFLRKKLHSPLIPCMLIAGALGITMAVSIYEMNSIMLSITVLDVGQGECVVFYSKGETAVVDCGGSGIDNAGDTAAEYLKSFGEDKIDYLILTHYHSDHVNGVTVLMERMEMGYLIVPEPFDDEDDGLSDEIIGLAEEKNITIIYITRDTVLSLGDAKLTLYAPAGGSGENENGLSVLCSAGDYDVIVTGDMNSDAERQLIESHELPDAELLIVGHHGSKYSTCEEFLQAVRPETAVISVGYNSYGHPSEEVLERLSSCGASVYRTDLSGNINIKVD